MLQDSAFDRLTSPLLEFTTYSIPSVILAAVVLYSALYLVANVTGGNSIAADLLGLRPKDKAGNRIPDGPIGIPVVGSFPFLTHYPEKTLDYWYKKFGPLYSMWLGDQLFMIVSDPGIAKDLLVIKGAIFSSRKAMYIKSQNIFAGRGVTVMPYDSDWRKQRRIASGWLHIRAVESYMHVLDYESRVMIAALFRAGADGAPINPQPFAGRNSLNNMLTITFGMRTDAVDHPFVAHALALAREFMNCTGPVSNLVDFVRPLQWVPTPLRTRARKLHNDLLHTYGGMVKDVERRMRAGEEVPDSVAKTLITVREDEKLDELDVTIMAAAFMIGGIESTASVMQWFSALIPAYPDVQRKAQEELDRVVGRERLPTIEDKKNLPYCRAIIKEVSRCRTPFWLGVPHVASEDFTYRGQFIPKGTVLILNAYTMHHDAGRYPEPERFNPERFVDYALSENESAVPIDPYARDHWMFGAGRRICPGMIVAEREIWLAISRMLWAFNMHEIPGEPIDLNEYDGLSGRSPVPFRIRLEPRHENVSKVLEVEGVAPPVVRREEALA